LLRQGGFLPSNSALDRRRQHSGNSALPHPVLTSTHIQMQRSPTPEKDQVVLDPALALTHKKTGNRTRHHGICGITFASQQLRTQATAPQCKRGAQACSGSPRLRPARHGASAARKLALGRCASLVFALALGCPHASAWPWPSNMVAAPPACDLGTSGSTFSNRACDAHRLSRVNVRAHPSCEPTHLCVPAARTDAALRRFARRRSPGRRRFSPTGLPGRF